ncbi:hypothetical protein ACHAWO_010771 [Cyclotella atomus]|uniref:AB hydrolase-1 domain-containing protein n=1 Tax=Cyclotella atomus TaxID=382360 RepID=A0ABD3ND63_9STRA
MIQPRIITYPIVGNEHGGILHVYGEPTSPNVILYCGGFPDDHKPFTPLARRLAEEADCVVGITCFPGFEPEAYHRCKFNGYKRRGYNFDEVCASIREATIQLFKQCDEAAADSTLDDAGTPQFTIILHDWGVIPGLMFVNRAIEMKYSRHVPNKIVLLDVLTWPTDTMKEDVPLQSEVSYSLRPSIYELTVCFAYRFALAASFFWLRFASDILGLINMAILTQLVVLFRLSPVKSLDSKLIDERAMQSKSSPLAYYRHLVYMCYPYYHMFIALLLQRGFEDIHIPRDLKATPILYIYGTDKNIMFHNWKSLAILEREEREGTSKCKVVAVEDAGHWMYVQKLERCFEEIKSFIR